jgi:hypothetical protein
VTKRKQHKSSLPATPIDYVVSFEYTDDGQWPKIKDLVSKLDHDADRTKIDINVFRANTFRGGLKVAAIDYRLDLAKEKIAFKGRLDWLRIRRDDAERLLTDIVDGALYFEVRTEYDFLPPVFFPLPGTSNSMVDDSKIYFTKLIEQLDGAITALGKTPEENARLGPRTKYWERLLSLWLSLGGLESGKLTATFLFEASAPVLVGDDADVKVPSIERWLRLRRRV